jgi:hypothetical protein
MPLFNVEMEEELVQLYEEYQVDIEEPSHTLATNLKQYGACEIPEIGGKKM